MRLSDRYSYEILCEDAQTRCFMIALLKKQGINRHKIYIDMAPAGTICGSQYVAQKYPDKVNDFLSRNYKNNVLIVCTDADNLSVEERVQFVENNAKDIKYNRQEVRIIIWIPRRQIENWIHFWQERTGEEIDFKHTGKPEKCRLEAEKMSDYLSDQIAVKDIIPSIEYAKKEYMRVCKMQIV